ncbi:MAG: HAD family phosphatase [Candidatus Nomurabacteria bacterium]|jgi:HAD superfamily hydrolase (TIGR01490 family)|nr:HAD family phosphatase [Candidatus Nomurabacteria bacterium]
MMKKFAVFDIDGTLIRWQLYHAVVNRLAASGALGDNFYNQIREARRKWKNRAQPFSEYERTLVDKFLLVMPQLDIQQYEHVIGDIWNEYRDQTYIYTRDLIKRLKKEGYFLLIISGSPSEVIERLAKYYDFDDFRACVFQRDQGGRFTGKITSPVHNKKLALQKLVKEHGLDWQGSIAVGDSGSDIAMLTQVEQPIAFNPDRVLFDAARERGWQIVIERKNVVYELTPCKNGAYNDKEARYELK